MSISFSQEISWQNNAVLVDVHKHDENAASSTYHSARKQLHSLSTWASAISTVMF